MKMSFLAAAVTLFTAVFSASALSQGAELYSCTGRGGVEGVTLWGPKGEPCGGMKSGNTLPWGTYANSCVRAESNDSQEATFGRFAAPARLPR